MRWVVTALVLLLVVPVATYRWMNSWSFQAFGGLTSRVETDRRVVALTFDDGPSCDAVDAVTKGLSGARATFFLIGSEMVRCPAAAGRLVRDGHELGNHTWDHRAMVFVSPQDVAREIEPTDALLRAAGQPGDLHVRPPYGKKLLVFPWWLDRHDRRTIMWDVAVETFDGTPQTAEAIARQTVAATRPGSIVLLHPWGGHTATRQAIPLVVADLRAQGYEFVTVSELLDIGTRPRS